MMQPLKRLIAALMALVLICTAVPFPAYAELIDTAPGYSFFGLIKPGEGQTIESLVDTYVFKDGETVVSTQSIKEGEETTVVAPASPEKTGYKFLGWKDSNGDPFTGAGKFIGGKTYTYTADFQEIYYVFFLDEGGRVIETREGTKGTVITADATFAVDPGEAISGWYTEAEKTNRVTSVTLKDQNITLYPKVEPGYWLEFETDGGTYFAPKFVAPGAATVRPATDPERPGYTFQGWVDADGNEFAFGKTITANTTVYAKWQGEPADYTVIYWQEHANDAEFSSVEVVKKSGYTGDVAVYDNKNYDGFTLITEGDKAPGEKTIAGDGSTIVNVYYSRNVYTIYFFDTNGSLTASYSCGLSEHKHSQWNCYELNCDRWFMHSHKFPDCYQLTCTKPEHTHNSSCIADSSSVSGYRYKIEAKHGAKIGNKWPTNKNGSTMWATNQDGSAPYQAGIDVMPIGGGSFYVPDTSSTKTSTAYYYVEVLEGETGDVTVGGRTYKFHHKDTAIGSGLTVTDEDFYPLTGFTKNTTDSTKNKSSYNGATFYYYRNVHTIKFMNNGTLDDTVPKQYEASIADADYTPNRPTTIPEDYTFKGWYDNEKCAGDAYVFEGKTMPDADITLYAKWEAPTFNATAHVTMAGTDSGQTFEIPYGSTIDKDSLPKYEVPKGYTDRGWAVKNGDKYEPFNFNTKIYQDITLYPYYTSNESFGVVYNANGGSGTVPTDSRKYADGTSADVKSAAGLTAPGGKVFLGWSLSPDGLSAIYQPGDKIQILAQNAQGETDHKVITLYAIWGDAPTGTTLTYHPNYPAGSTGHGSENAVVVETINNAIVTLQGAGNFECDGYEFRGWSTTAGGSVNYTAGEKVLVDNKDTNDLYAVWQANKFDVTYTYTGAVPTGAPALPEATEATVKSTVQVADKPTMDGYTFDGWKLGDEVVTSFKMPAHDVELTGSWTIRSDLSYTVRYQWNGQDIDPKKNETFDGQTFGATVSATPISIDGYTPVSMEAETCQIGTGSNEIIINYYKNVTLQANSGTYTYDGTKKTVSGYTCMDGTTKVEFDTTITATGSGTNADKYDVDFDKSYTGTVDKTGKYYVTGQTKGILDITPITSEVTVTITGNSDSKVYNTNEQSVSGFTTDVGAKTISVALAEGSKAEAKGTDVGHYTMGLTADDFVVTSDNYSNIKVEVVDGYLDITPITSEVTVTITGNSDSKVYNTNEQSVSGFTTDVGAKTISVALAEGSKAEAKGTDVGHYTMGLTADDFVVTSDNYSNIKVEVVDGYLDIEKAQAKVVANPATKKYGEKDPEFTAKVYLVVGDKETEGVYEGDTISYTISRKDAEKPEKNLVGSYGEVIIPAEKDPNPNYDVTYVSADFTIEATGNEEIVTKTIGDQKLNLGETATFTITVANIFNTEKTMTVTELPGVSIKSCDVTGASTVGNVVTATLQPGQVATITAQCVVDEAMIRNGYTNEVTVKLGDLEGEAEAVLPTAPVNAALEVTKTSEDKLYSLADTITYTITVKNTGNVTLTDLQIVDELTGGVTEVTTVDGEQTSNSIAPNETRTYTATYTVTKDDVKANANGKVVYDEVLKVSYLTNTVVATAKYTPTPAEAAAATDDKQAGTASETIQAQASVTNRVVHQDLNIEKIVLNPQDVYDFGEVIHYQITVTNNGTYTEPAGLTITDQMNNATGNVTYGDDWKNGVYTLPQLNPGDSKTVYCSYTVQESDFNRVLSNTAVVRRNGTPEDISTSEGSQVIHLYSLAILYLDADTGNALADTYLVRLKAGTPFYVKSPVIDGYTTDILAIKSGVNGMPAQDLIFKVLYTAVEEPEEEPEEPEVNVVTPTEDGGYDLTPIGELDTPLADMDLGDHTCCIMHFLLMLASLITLAFYTDSRKKHQARIHQLRQSLRAEGKDDPSEKM